MADSDDLSRNVFLRTLQDRHRDLYDRAALRDGHVLCVPHSVCLTYCLYIPHLCWISSLLVFFQCSEGPLESLRTLSHSLILRTLTSSRSLINLRMCHSVCRHFTVSHTNTQLRCTHLVSMLLLISTLSCGTPPLFIHSLITSQTSFIHSSLVS